MLHQYNKWRHVTLGIDDVIIAEAIFVEEAPAVVAVVVEEAPVAIAAVMIPIYNSLL